MFRCFLSECNRMKDLKKKLTDLKTIAQDKLNGIKPQKIVEACKKRTDGLEIGRKLKLEALHLKSLNKKLLNAISDNSVKMSGVIGAFLADKDLLRYLETLTKSAASVYDKALDREYLISHIGGGYHRLVDGGHDLFHAWERVKDALPDDTFGQEVVGYVTALWKDVSTVQGLPFFTLQKEQFDSWVEATSHLIPGLNRKYLYDLLSFDAYELLSSGIATVGVIFALKKDDQEKLAELLGSMGIISILSANPIMGIIAIGTSAYAYTKKKMEFDKKSFMKSAIITTTSMALFSFLGLPILFELVIVAVVTRVLRKKVLDDDKLLEAISIQIKAIGSKTCESAANMLKVFNTHKKAI